MATETEIKRLKKQLKIAQSEFTSEQKLDKLVKTISKEDLKILKEADNKWSEGAQTKIVFTMEVEMTISASPMDSFEGSLDSSDFKVLRSDGIPMVLAKELMETVEYSQHDSYSNFSWAKNLKQAKSVLKEAQLKAKDYDKVMKQMAKKYEVKDDLMFDVVFESERKS